jgi:hypothetical protein
LIEVLTLQLLHVQRSQKHVPIGIHCMQEKAPVVVWVMMLGVVIVPVKPVTGTHSAIASKSDVNREQIMA